jgi:type IV pilus assembly protein PilA
MRRILSHRPRPDDDEDGFTLIELMVVVLIIAILIAIAIPTFLGARQRAQDRATQADLRNALTAQKTFYTDGEVFADNSAAGSISLASIEPRIAWMTKLTWNTDAATNSVLCLEQTSNSGTTFAIADVATGPTAGTYFSPTACPGVINGSAFSGWQTGGW